MPKITSREEAQAYFETQPQERVVALAARSALRALPGLGPVSDEVFGRIALPVFRATLTSAVAAVSPTEEVKTAAYSAADSAADSALRSAASAADSAASAADSAASAASAAYSAARSAASAASAVDSAARSVAYAALSGDTDSQDLWQRQLWGGSEPADWRVIAERKLFEKLGADDWVFWRRWYRGCLDGRPLDWELQRRVALIPDEDWEKGTAHIAGLIAGIERDYEAEKRERYREQAQRLIARKASTRAISDGLSRMIRAAVDAYKAELGHPNSEQPVLEPLEKLAALFSKVSGAFELEHPEEALTELIAAMAGTITELNHRLARAQAQCKLSQRDGTVKAVVGGFVGGFATGLATPIGQEAIEILTAPELWASILSGADYVIGETTRVVENLAELTCSMMGPEADPRPEDWLLQVEAGPMSDIAPEVSQRPEVRPKS